MALVRLPERSRLQGKRTLELQSKLLVSPFITPVVLPHIFPYIRSLEYITHLITAKLLRRTFLMGLLRVAGRGFASLASFLRDLDRSRPHMRRNRVELQSKLLEGRGSVRGLGIL